MREWPMDTHPVQAGYSPDRVQEWCVRDGEWQQVRLSMKGIPTEEKLMTLKAYWDRKAGLGLAPERVVCQVSNYLGALRRGGQLDMENRVRKYI